jgi:DNA-binding PadR family transcriptional regulator
MLGSSDVVGVPLHGYEVRQESEKWSADKWANVAYGSIYHALNKMRQEGLVEVIDAEQVGKRPARTVYQVTDRGRAEFERLLRGYWVQVRPLIDPFQVAIAFMDRLPREELLTVLRRRAVLLRAELEVFAYGAETKLRSVEVARHIAENLRLARSRLEVELHWVEQAIEKVDRGELP